MGASAPGPARLFGALPELACEAREAMMISLTGYLNSTKPATRLLHVTRSRQNWRQL
jgi:hypothetical protein